MPQQAHIAEFARSYNSMSGADIKAVFAGKVFGELQAISYAVTREKAPVYTMGSSDPRSYSRNKRGIAGSFVWINFDRHSLLNHFKNATFIADVDDIRPEWQDVNGSAVTSDVYGVTVAQITNDLTTGSGVNESELGNNSLADQIPASPWYADQVPPFDIVLVANNEYGASAKMKLIGVEILNDGLGVSIDDNVIESQSTFVARTILPFTPVYNTYRDKVGFNSTFNS